MISAEALACISLCLKSRVARRILAALSCKPIGITAICRRTGCPRRDALRYLSLLKRAGVVVEERCGRLRLFKLLNNDFSQAVLEAVKILEVGLDE